MKRAGAGHGRLFLVAACLSTGSAFGEAGPAAAQNRPAVLFSIGPATQVEALIGVPSLLVDLAAAFGTATSEGDFSGLQLGGAVTAVGGINGHAGLFHVGYIRRAQVSDTAHMAYFLGAALSTLCFGFDWCGGIGVAGGVDFGHDWTVGAGSVVSLSCRLTTVLAYPTPVALIAGISLGYRN